MIPNKKTEAVERALREAFGVCEFEDIQKLTEGLSSALIFRINVQGHPYLLRVMMSDAEDPGPGQGNPTHLFTRMRDAADAGLAPRVWYTSVEDRISITDFIQARPFPRSEALVRLPRLLQRLHDLPPVPKTVDYLKVVDGFIARFRAAKILPADETDELFQRYAPLASIYPRDEAEMVLCHNDLKPENILFDGERPWLVDWEAAFMNDRYFDLALIANFLITTDDEEEALLHSYFGRAADAYTHARFYLMRQITHMSYAMVFLQIGSQGKPINAHAEVPAFRDFHERIWAGRQSLASSEAKVQYGRVHLQQLGKNLRGDRFREALRVLSLGC